MFEYIHVVRNADGFYLYHYDDRGILKSGCAMLTAQYCIDYATEQHPGVPVQWDI